MRKILYSISFYFSRWFYAAGAFIIALYICAWFVPGLQQVASLLLLCLSVLVFIDILLLFSSKKTINANRELPPRFSNGDENKVIIQIENLRPYKIYLSVIDELPVQFQQRKWKKEISISANKNAIIEYYLKPTERGEYDFGIINIFLNGPLQMVVRHIKKAEEDSVAVYPRIPCDSEPPQDLRPAHAASCGDRPGRSLAGVAVPPPACRIGSALAESPGSASGRENRRRQST